MRGFFKNFLKVLQVVGIFYGAYCEFAPASWPFQLLPRGMGAALALICATMLLVVQEVENERQSREEMKAAINVAASKMALCLPYHEREFYAVFRNQLFQATNTVDVCYFGKKPPRFEKGGTEQEYYKELKEIVSSTKAHVRRAERYSPDKKKWLESLCKEFNGVNNFSLCLYKDSSSEDIPSTLSVCRVDDKFSWLIAAAEHDTTSNFRDLLLTGEAAANLIRGYFQKRIWDRSTVLIERGVLVDNWETLIK